MTDQLELPDATGGRDRLSRRRFFATSAGLAGTLVAGRASAESLANVPPREDGADLGGHSERSQYVKIARIPEAGPGKRNVDPSDAINSKAPLDKLVGGITPTDLHYERSHSGAPDLDPAKHRMLVHGMVQRPLKSSSPAQIREFFLEKRVPSRQLSGRVRGNAPGSGPR